MHLGLYIYGQVKELVSMNRLPINLILGIYIIVNLGTDWQIETNKLNRIYIFISTLK